MPHKTINTQSLVKTQQHNAQGMELYIEENKLGFSFIRIPGKEMLFVEAEQELLKNKWQHITVSYDGSQKPSGIKMYLNGKLLKQKTIHDNLKPQFTNKHPFFIGRRIGRTNTNNPITLLQVYDRVLAPNEIKITGELRYNDLAFVQTDNKNFELNQRMAFITRIRNLSLLSYSLRGMLILSHSMILKI